MLADAEDVALSFEQNTLDQNKSVQTDKIRYYLNLKVIAMNNFLNQGIRLHCYFICFFVQFQYFYFYFQHSSLITL